MELHHVRAGRGEPLLLIHGLGGSWRSWHPILSTLAHHRELWLLDLPGHGATPALPGRATVAALTDAVEAFVRDRGLGGVGAVGSSMGGRMVLELARRGVVGPTVALDPGGFGRGWEQSYLRSTFGASIALLRWLDPALPTITARTMGRAVLLAQLSNRPWAVPPELALSELRGYVATRGYDALLDDLAYGPLPAGAAATRGPITIVWGRDDRVSLPRQAPRAIATFPAARLVWIERCGHFPHWDAPRRTESLILAADRAPRRLERAPVLAGPALAT